ncbi:MAG: hypothetical protein FJ087_08375 [Deltaproteobacteria bacterium]|nr:hypothetical protein [Deltaproteobacteria bacterium]
MITRDVRLLGVLACAAALLSTATAVAQTVPRTLSVQGVLRNVAGEVVNGDYSLTFRLFTTETGGTHLFEWTPGTPVQVTGGIFNVEVPLGSNLFESNPHLFLEIQVGTDRMARKRVVSVGYALTAEKAATATVAAEVTCTSCVSASEVSFSWARGVAANGAAADLNCDGAGCVGSTELASNLSLQGTTTLDGNANVVGSLQTLSGGAITAAGQISTTYTHATYGPLNVGTNTNKVTNLNADLLDGLDSAYFLDASHLTGALPPTMLPTATTTSKGVMQVGTGLSVSAGVVANDGVRSLSVQGGSPLTIGGADPAHAPVLSLPAAGAGQSGYLSATDWATFNGKLSALALRSGDPLVGNGSAASPLGISRAGTGAGGGWISDAEFAAFNGKAPASPTGAYVQLQAANPPSLQAGGIGISGNIKAEALVDAGNTAYWVDPSTADLSVNVAGRIATPNTVTGSVLVATTTTSAPLTVSSSTVVPNLNAYYVQGKVPGNADGNIALANGAAVTNLNADMVDGQHASAFVTTGQDFGRSGISNVLYAGGTSPGGKGLVMPYEGSTPVTGPAIRWSDGTTANTIGLYIGSGLHYQGDDGNPHFYVNVPTNGNGIGIEVLRVDGNSGDVAIQSKHAFRGNDSWLRLNQDGAFTGTYSPYLLRTDGGLASGGYSPGDVGGGNIRAAGTIKAYSGFVGDAGANIGGTGAAAYFPSGVYVNGANNWMYGTTYAFNGTWYDANNSGYYVDPNNTSVFNRVDTNTQYTGDLHYNNMRARGYSYEYGFLGSNVYADTINTGCAGDPLEFNYHRGGEYRFGQNASSGNSIVMYGPGQIFSYNAESTGAWVRLGSAWNRPGVYSNGDLFLGSEGAVYINDNNGIQWGFNGDDFWSRDWGHMYTTSNNFHLDSYSGAMYLNHYYNNYVYVGNPGADGYMKVGATYFYDANNSWSYIYGRTYMHHNYSWLIYTYYHEWNCWWQAHAFPSLCSNGFFSKGGYDHGGSWFQTLCCA